MIEVKNIDVTYQQAGNICMFASYGIIINYFSKKAITFDQIYLNVIDQFPGLKHEIESMLTKSPSSDIRVVSEDIISTKYHIHCRNVDIRGFDYIKSLHDTNALGTKQFCLVKESNAVYPGFIQLSERMSLRDNLMKIGGLAMVLFPVGPNWHAIVIGFDTINNSYFKTLLSDKK